MAPPQVPQALLKARNLARILDTVFTLPFVRIKLGVDFLVGLIPGLGDGVMLLTSLMMLRYAGQLNAPRHIKVLMIRNSILDFLFGLIPIVGDIVDLFFKANRANARLLESWWLSEHGARISQNTQKALQEWESKNTL